MGCGIGPACRATSFCGAGRPQPSLRDSRPFGVQPSVKTLGYARLSLRDSEAAVSNLIFAVGSSHGNPNDEWRMRKESRTSKSKAARQDIMAFHLVFGFRFSFDIRHLDFAIIQNLPSG